LEEEKEPEDMMGARKEDEDEDVSLAKSLANILYG